MLRLEKETIRRFDLPGPRYTSYPTAPEWRDDIPSDLYYRLLAELGRSGHPVSLYVHIPFCASLCSYCGCTCAVRLPEAKYGDQYLDHLGRETELLSTALGTTVTVPQLHLGGGTPTFLDVAQLHRLFALLRSAFSLDPSGERAVEIDPRTVDRPKLEALSALGFNRISLGVQDFDATVQAAVNRIQPFAQVAERYRDCRELGFTSINFDLIYGLPHQTPRSIGETLDQVLLLRPDRLACYSYANVPWLKRHQRRLVEFLPSAEEKLDLFLLLRERLLTAGYQAIAMDHFALPGDSMARAYEEGKLYRNFMGYTLRPAEDFLGLGVSSIGLVGHTFVQNEPRLPEYYRAIDTGAFAIARGKVLSFDDRARQWVISSLMCHFRVDKDEFLQAFEVEFDRYFAEEEAHLARCHEDGLLEVRDRVLEATDLGRLFIRNVCMGFDAYLENAASGAPRFSRTV
ncbi:MAG: oxygen-independent coproporphyrinogen III oxidase [Deltaproteobacteria bacterium RIFOXYA12_FULL_61_11]|nr:MAG: oxygen-independent coproporphyrinogen III oxidase [Deltaproteobacteria bacterium RIFOXYA12_FULL_61_11]